MNCKKCGTEFDSNFCPNCGEPIPKKTICEFCGVESDSKFCPNCGKEKFSDNKKEKYPDIPIGTYKGTFGTITIDNESVTIIKMILFIKTTEKVLISDLANVYIEKGILGGFICIRSKNNIFKPLSDKKTSASDPFSLDFANPNIDDFYAIYDFLYKVVQINDFEQAPYKQSNNMFQEKQNIHISIQNQTPTQIERPHKKSKRELKRDAHNSGQACCPKCGSVSLSANKKGFGVGKALLGASATMITPLGPLGAVAGNINARKVWVTCLNCGHRWKL